MNWGQCWDIEKFGGDLYPRMDRRSTRTRPTRWPNDLKAITRYIEIWARSKNELLINFHETFFFFFFKFLHVYFRTCCQKIVNFWEIYKPILKLLFSNWWNWLYLPQSFCYQPHNKNQLLLKFYTTVYSWIFPTFITLLNSTCNIFSNFTGAM